VPVPENLPEAVQTGLAAFLTAAHQAFADDLVAVVLFGSAADGRLRPTSDVNLVVVLARYDPASAAAVGDAYRLAQAAIRLSAMFIVEDEIAAASEAFAVKFADIAARHVVLYGRNVFAGLTTSRAATLNRLRQVSLNLLLRMREIYIADAPFPEKLAYAAAEAVGPLRAAAATLLSVRDGETLSPRDALRRLADAAGQGPALDLVSEARDSGAVPTAGGDAALLAAIGLAAMVHDTVARLT
jgi:predicted nucleotidyltransferase